MAQKCLFELEVDPRCADMGKEEFRSYVVDQCFPPMWECMGTIKPKFNLIDDVLDGNMRDGSAHIEIKGSSSGDWEVKAGATWEF